MAQMKFCKKQKILRNKKINFGIGQTDYNYLKYNENLFARSEMQLQQNNF